VRFSLRLFAEWYMFRVLSYSYDGPLLKPQTWSGGLVSGTVTRTKYDGNFRLEGRELRGPDHQRNDYDNDGLLKLAGVLSISRNTTTRPRASRKCHSPR
jgi:hypothetical protein